MFSLGYSRKCIRLIEFRSNARTSYELPETTFRRISGVTKIMVFGANLTFAVGAKTKT